MCKSECLSSLFLYFCLFRQTLSHVHISFSVLVLGNWWVFGVDGRAAGKVSSEDATREWQGDERVVDGTVWRFVPQDSVSCARHLGWSATAGCFLCWCALWRLIDWLMIDCCSIQLVDYLKVTWLDQQWCTLSTYVHKQVTSMNSWLCLGCDNTLICWLDINFIH